MLCQLMLDRDVPYDGPVFRRGVMRSVQAATSYLVGPRFVWEEMRDDHGEELPVQLKQELSDWAKEFAASVFARI